MLVFEEHSTPLQLQENLPQPGSARARELKPSDGLHEKKLPPKRVSVRRCENEESGFLFHAPRHNPIFDLLTNSMTRF